MNKEEDKFESLCSTSEKGEKLFSDSEVHQITIEIGRRIVEAFDYQSDAEIAFLLKTKIASVKLITEGEEFPPTEMLLCIHKITGVSIDWILTGEGTKHKNLVEFLTVSEIAIAQ
jgi:hypothetical protein